MAQQKKKTETAQQHKHDNIYGAINAIRNEVQGIIKDTEAPESAGGFAYASAAAVQTRLRPLMIKHGVVRYKQNSTIVQRYANGAGVDIDVTYRYALADATHMEEGKTYIDVKMSGSGKTGGGGDKSMFAAATTTSKYADLDLFYLPMYDDIEAFEQHKENAGQTNDEAPAKTKPKRQESEPEPEDPDEGEEEEQEEEKSSSKKGKGSGGRRKKSEPEEPEPDPDESGEDEGEEVDLEEIDYDDDDEIEKLFNQLDLSDDELFEECLDAFEDYDKLKAFYNEAVNYIAQQWKNGSKKAESFNEKWRETVTEKLEELAED